MWLFYISGDKEKSPKKKKQKKADTTTATTEQPSTDGAAGNTNNAAAATPAVATGAGSAAAAASPVAGGHTGKKSQSKIESFFAKKKTTTNTPAAPSAAADAPATADATAKETAVATDTTADHTTHKQDVEVMEIDTIEDNSQPAAPAAQPATHAPTHTSPAAAQPPKERHASDFQEKEQQIEQQTRNDSNHEDADMIEVDDVNLNRSPDVEVTVSQHQPVVAKALTNGKTHASSEHDIKTSAVISGAEDDVQQEDDGGTVGVEQA